MQKKLFGIINLDFNATGQLMISYSAFIKYLLTPWSRFLLEKLTVSQLVKKFPAFHGTRRFITAFTRARHLFLFWDRSIQSMLPTYFLKIHLNIILPFTSGSSEWSLSVRFSHQYPVHTSPHTCYNPGRSHSSRFDHPTDIWRGVQL